MAWKSDEHPTGITVSDIEEATREMRKLKEGIRGETIPIKIPELPHAWWTAERIRATRCGDNDMISDEWETPDDLFDKLNQEFNFIMDMAASKNNKKLKLFFTETDNSLNLDWSEFGGCYWLNPPYSRNLIKKFMHKVVEENFNGNVIVCLVRFDPTASWFKECVDGIACEVRMLPRRVKFKGADSAYNFPNCIVVYDNEVFDGKTEYKYWDWLDENSE